MENNNPKERIDASWQGIDFTLVASKTTSVPPILSALISRDVRALKKHIISISRRPQRISEITRWLNENFSPQAAEILWEEGLVSPTQSWGWAIDNRSSEQIAWWVSDGQRIVRLCSSLSQGGQQHQTIKDWGNEMRTLARLAPDVYLSAMENADWATLLSKFPVGERGLLVEAWVNAFVNSSSDPEKASQSLARAFTPSTLQFAFGSQKGFSVNEAQAGLINPVRVSILTADAQSAARLQRLVKASEQLSTAWENHWIVNKDSTFARKCGLSIRPAYYSSSSSGSNRWPDQQRSHVPRNILEDMLCHGSPALCFLLNRSPPPNDDPGGLAHQVCLTLTDHPVLAHFLFTKASPQQSPTLAARILSWMPEVRDKGEDFMFNGMGLEHLALYSVPTAGMAVALARANTPDNPLFRKMSDGTSALDILIAKTDPKPEVIDKVLSARSHKKRKSLIKVVEEKTTGSQKKQHTTPFM